MWDMTSSYVRQEVEEWVTSTASSVEDETRNGRRYANRNTNRNPETTILRLFTNFQMKRDLEQ